MYHPTVVKRSSKRALEVIIEGLPSGLNILESTLEWRIISGTKLKTSAGSAQGTLVSRGTAEWTIKRRSLSAGVYQVKFSASYTVGDPAFPQTLKAFNYGFIEVISAPLRAILDSGSSVRWGSAAIVTVDGSLSYDEDIGPRNNTGLNFGWSCLHNASVSNDCFGSFHGAVNSMPATAISIDSSRLETGNTYVLRLNVTKDERSSAAETSFEIAAGEIPQVTLR